MIMETAENIITEGSKMGKGTKVGLVIGGVSLVALGIYKTVKFVQKKKESKEIEDTAIEHEESEEYYEAE